MDSNVILENAVGKKAEEEILPLQPGGVPNTFPDLTDLVEQFHFQPSTTLKVGIDQLVAWYFNEFNASLA